MVDVVDIVVARRIVVEVHIGGEIAGRTVGQIQVGGRVGRLMLRVIGGRDAVRVVWLDRRGTAGVQLVQRFVMRAARAEQKAIHARA